MATHVSRSPSLDLPSPSRAAAPLLILAVVGVLLEIDPRLPWAAGALVAVSFAAAGAVRTMRAWRELAQVRRTADRLIVHAPRTRDAAELIRWRSAELTTAEQRRRLASDVDRLLRSLDAGLLPSASPVRRVAARRHADLLRSLATRLRDDRVVEARGILLARELLCDPAGPLYAEEAEGSLARAITRTLGALEP